MTSHAKPQAPNAYRELRRLTGLTQSQLAELVGVHPVTISGWERGGTEPNPWQHAMLLAISQAALNSPGAPLRACRMLRSQGLGRALLELLKVAYLPPLQPAPPAQASTEPA